MKSHAQLSLLILALSLCAGVSASSIDDVRLKAEQGDASAQFELAMAYDQGTGVKKDAVAAANWCLKAAEQGLAPAQNCIGSMLQFGDGVAQDDAAAVSWYEKAAAQGYGESYTNLAYMYDLGKGVPQDRAKAVDLYRKGAETGSVNAMFNLGITFWKGTGVPVDRVEAYMWLDLARFYTQRSNDMRVKWSVRGALDELQKEMSRSEISEGERRAQEWDAAHRPM